MAQATPLDKKSHLPSPLTHLETTATDECRASTLSADPDRSSQARQRTPISTPPHHTMSSPPSDTQPFSQFVPPPQTLSYDVEDEEAEGVWGYLIPLDNKFGDTLVLKRRATCPASTPKSDFGRGAGARWGKGTDFVQEEEAFEQNKEARHIPAGGYLIGRHPECGQSHVIL